MMKKNAKIYVAGHRGMVGSAIVRELNRQGYNNIITIRMLLKRSLPKRSRNMYSWQQPRSVVLLPMNLHLPILCTIT